MAAIVTIPAHLPFLSTLAHGLLAAGADRLADTLLLLPSRRACLLARDAFTRAAGGRTLLLPRMVPVGELDPLDWLPDGPDEPDGLPPAQPLPPPMPSLRRRLLLTRLVLAQNQHSVEQAVRLAGELARLQDELTVEGVAPGRLATIVPDELAQHWQLTLRFLRLLEEAWPALLAVEGTLDPAARRNALLVDLLARWRRNPPTHPVTVAGVSGSVPAVGELVASVATLPQGFVVLSGLDRELDEASWRALPAAHPQWHARRLLELAGVERAAVPDWPPPISQDALPPGAAAGRTRVWRAAMRPAASSDGMLEAAILPPRCFAGLEVEEHRELGREALSLSLRIREALETPDRTVALVTPDRNLARRVAVELGRWGIAAIDSAGVPLDQSPPGSFLLLTAHLAADAAAPVPLLAALKHPLAAGGQTKGEFRRHVRALEVAVLRGSRPAPGFAGLRAALAARAADMRGWPVTIPPANLLAWLDGLAAMAAPLLALMAADKVPLQALIDAHLAFATALAGGDGAAAAQELWAREAGAEAARFMTDLAGAAEALDAMPGNAYPAILAVLMGGVAVRPQRPGHPRLAIMGQLESRLVHADLVLLGGLNEGIWPAAVESGPWLSRRMRVPLDLPPAEQALGIAAADLVAAAMAPHVVLSRSRKDVAGSPTIPSRWLQRLQAVAKAAGQSHLLQPDPAREAWLDLLDATPGPAQPCPQPRPCPPPAARPRELRATDVEKLLRDPYRLYAERILGLSPLDPLDAEPDAADRGTLIHEALHRFVSTYPAELPEDAAGRLLEIGWEIMAPLRREPVVLALWWPRFERIAAWFLEQEAARRADLRELFTEIKGELVVDAPGGPVTIRARADRVERGREGGLSLIDYKTGRLPDARLVARGLSPQLAVEALIAVAGGFQDLPAGSVEGLLYWRLQGGPDRGEERSAAGDKIPIARLIAEAQAFLPRLLEHFDRPATPYLAIPRPEVAARGDAFEHLARIAEWRGWGGSG